MKERRLTIRIGRPLTREELRRERRWRIAENIVNVLLGFTIVGVMFWAGYLVGSGAFSVGV